MPGRSEPKPDRMAGDIDSLARLAADGSISRRQILSRAFGLAAVAILPSWIPAAQSRAAGFFNAHISISSLGKCPPPEPQVCPAGTTLAKWSPACEAPISNGVRAEFNGCGPEKWNHLWKPVKALAKLADHPTLLTSFTKACNAHDCCYGTCGSLKETCDRQIRSDLIDACVKSKDTLPGGGVLSLTYQVLCTATADAYYAAIADTKQGKSAFASAQGEVCGCCEESGPCGGKTCREGEICCQGKTCYDPQCFACCNLASHPGQLTSIFLSPGGDPTTVAFCIACGQGGVAYAHHEGETCEEILEQYPGCECAGPFAAVSGRFDYCEGRPP